MKLDRMLQDVYKILLKNDNIIIGNKTPCEGFYFYHSSKLYRIEFYGRYYRFWLCNIRNRTPIELLAQGRTYYKIIKAVNKLGVCNEG